MNDVEAAIEVYETYFEGKSHHPFYFLIHARIAASASNMALSNALLNQFKASLEGTANEVSFLSPCHVFFGLFLMFVVLSQQMADWHSPIHEAFQCVSSSSSFPDV